MHEPQAERGDFQRISGVKISKKRAVAGQQNLQNEPEIYDIYDPFLDAKLERIFGSPKNF